MEFFLPSCAWKTPGKICEPGKGATRSPLHALAFEFVITIEARACIGLSREGTDFGLTCVLSGAAGVSCIFSRIRVAFWGFVCRTVTSFFFRLELGRRPARYILLESRRDGSRAYMCALGCGEPLSPFLHISYIKKRALRVQSPQVRKSYD